MKVVYDHVTSLDFIDDPDIFIEPDKDRTIKDIMAFIELLLAKSTK